LEQFNAQFINLEAMQMVWMANRQDVLAEILKSLEDAIDIRYNTTADMRIISNGVIGGLLSAFHITKNSKFLDEAIALGHIVATAQRGNCFRTFQPAAPTKEWCGPYLFIPALFLDFASSSLLINNQINF
jgi:hypothetical protein